MPHFTNKEVYNDDNDNIIFGSSSSSNSGGGVYHDLNASSFPSFSPPSTFPSSSSSTGLTQPLQDASLSSLSSNVNTSQQQQNGEPTFTQQQQQTTGSTVPKNREEMMTAIEETIEQIITAMAYGEEIKVPFAYRPRTSSSNTNNSRTTSSTQAPSTQTQQVSSTQTQTQQRKRRRSINAEEYSSTQAAEVDSSQAIGDATQEEDDDMEIEEEEISIRSTRKVRNLSLKGPVTAKTFARHLSILQMIYEALAYKVVVTKRDMYYRNVQLFGKQSVVDTIVDDISCHYNVPRSSLNVSAASKGLVYGPLIIKLKSNKMLDCTSAQHADADEASDEQGTLIPPISQVAQVCCLAKFMIVIEKEATFRHLVSIGFCQKFPHSCILATGKGYPDLCTRQFVKYISTHYSKMPIFALMDNDPHGLDIYACYKWGARALAFDVLNLAINEIQFLGLSCQDRAQFNISSDCRLPLTDRDRSKLLSMLRTDNENEEPGSNQLRDRGWRNNTHEQLLTSQDHRAYVNELNQMLKSDYKCELQALNHDGPYGLSNYLTSKLARYRF